MDTGIQILESITLLSIFKVLIVTLLLVYGVFAFLMMKQVGAMTRAVVIKDDYIMRLISIAHFALAVLVLLLALVIL